MGLIYGAEDTPRDRLHVTKIAGTWVATFRGGPTERIAREWGTSTTFELPYSPALDASTVARLVQTQNPGLLVIVDGPRT